VSGRALPVAMCQRGQPCHDIGKLTALLRSGWSTASYRTGCQHQASDIRLTDGSPAQPPADSALTWSGLIACDGAARLLTCTGGLGCGFSRSQAGADKRDSRPMRDDRLKAKDIL
jgi:hypothetical protein